MHLKKNTAKNELKYIDSKDITKSNRLMKAISSKEHEYNE